MAGQTVAVVGASADRTKFGNKAVRAFRDAGWIVYPVHPTLPDVEAIKAYPSLDAVPVDALDRVSLYVPPAVGEQMLDQIARKKVGEVWLNPGTESPSLLGTRHGPGDRRDSGVQHPCGWTPSRQLLKVKNSPIDAKISIRWPGNRIVL